MRVGRPQCFLLIVRAKCRAGRDGRVGEDNDGRSAPAHVVINAGLGRMISHSDGHRKRDIVT